MADKKTFPGALNAAQQEALAKQQREAEKAKKLAAEQENAARILANQKKKEAEKRKAIINVFAPDLKSKLVTFGLVCLPLNALVGVMDHVLADQDPYDNDLSIIVKPSDAIREAYDPYFHAADFSKENPTSFRDSKINNRFKRHMVLVGIEAFILACIIIGDLRKRNAVIKDIDTMLSVKDLGNSYMVHKDALKKMVKVAPEIVRHMSKDSSVYFEMLMNGDFDCEQDAQVLEFAKAVLAGHLYKHPEDLNRVLSVYDESTLPQSLIAHYKQNAR